jgi:hypothetical protein
MRPPGSPEELERRRHRAMALLSPRGVAPLKWRVGSAWIDAVPAAGRRRITTTARRRCALAGRPPKLAPRHLLQVERVLLKGAKAAGFGTDLWTCPRIAQVMARRFGVQYHVAHLSRLLRALGWSPQKPQRRATAPRRPRRS